MGERGGYLWEGWCWSHAGGISPLETRRASDPRAGSRAGSGVQVHKLSNYCGFLDKNRNPFEVQQFNLFFLTYNLTFQHVCVSFSSFSLHEL